MEELGIRLGPKPVSPNAKKPSTKGRHGEDLEYWPLWFPSVASHACARVCGGTKLCVASCDEQKARHTCG